MKKLLLIFILALVLVNGAKSQVLFASNAFVVCPGSTNVTVSLVASNFISVPSISLEIPYDVTSIQYFSFSASALLSGGFMQVNASGNMVWIAWFGLNAVTIPDDSMVIDLHFNYITDSSYLTLTGLTGPGTTSMVIPGIPAITQQPSSVSVNNGGLVQFNVVSQLPANSQYQWQMSSNNGSTWANVTNGNPYSGTNTPVLSLNPVTPGLDGYLYRCQVTSCQSILFSNPATLTVIIPASILINLNYLNPQNTALTNTAVYLMQNYIPIYTMNTGTTGIIQQSNMAPGVYDVLIDCQKPWGGGNALDALLIMKHFTGMILLSGMGLQVADVDNNGTVNSVDALLILKRFVGMINSFPSPDWQYDVNTATISPNGQTTLQIKARCTGDVEGGYVIP